MPRMRVPPASSSGAGKGTRHLVGIPLHGRAQAAVSIRSVSLLHDRLAVDLAHLVLMGAVDRIPLLLRVAQPALEAGAAHRRELSKHLVIFNPLSVCGFRLRSGLPGRGNGSLLRCRRSYLSRLGSFLRRRRRRLLRPGGLLGHQRRRRSDHQQKGAQYLSFHSPPPGIRIAGRICHNPLPFPPPPVVKRAACRRRWSGAARHRRTAPFRARYRRGTRQGGQVWAG